LIFEKLSLESLAGRSEVSCTNISGQGIPTLSHVNLESARFLILMRSTILTGYVDPSISCEILAEREGLGRECVMEIREVEYTYGCQRLPSYLILKGDESRRVTVTLTRLTTRFHSW
jgi:hypothetical protein